MDDYDIASKMGIPSPDTVEEAVRQRDHWINCAAQHHRNEDYYRGLVQRIGAMLGPDAFTQDDGGVVDDVLCAKVPGLVQKRLTMRPSEPDVVDALCGARISLKARSVGTPKIDAILGPMHEEDREKARAVFGHSLHDDPGVVRHYGETVEVAAEDQAGVLRSPILLHIETALRNARINLKMWSMGTPEIDEILGPMPEEDREKARRGRGGSLYDDPGVEWSGVVSGGGGGDATSKADVSSVQCPYEFGLIVGETVKIHGMPYTYLGNGRLGGGTDPAMTRAMRDGAGVYTSYGPGDGRDSSSDNCNGRD